MSYNSVGKIWTPGSFREYLGTIKAPTWAKAVTLHHCSSPSLAQRPEGLKAQHIINIRDYYRNTKGWSSGPHLFTDEDQIFGMTPLSEKGVHAVSFNSTSIGIEALGDYDSEDPKSGRGLATWKTTAATTKALLDWLKLPVTSKTVLFHNEDPKTDKTCPGTKVKKDWILQLINEGVSPVVVPKVETAEVIKYVVANKGYQYDAAVKLLKKRGNLFFFGEDWLEGAFYDSTLQSTVCSINELAQVRPAK